MSMKTSDHYRPQLFLMAARGPNLDAASLFNAFADVLWRQRRWIVMGLCAGIVMTVVNLDLSPVVYESTVTIRTDKPPVLPGEEGVF